MNYFGHAAVASWTGNSDSSDGASLGAIALGSMLPDFAGMCRARLAEHSADPGVERGIALHHRTDAAFHHLPAVVGLMRELDDRLDRGGCARGPRRAVAHIGIELLLDGVLVDDAAYVAAYRAALAHDLAGIGWREPDDVGRFAHLHGRLAGYGPPFDLRQPIAIVDRLARVLGGRPLIAPSPSDLRAIATALAAQQPRVVVAADTVMHGVRGAMAA